MQDKFWTPELWCEFLEGYSISSGMDILKAAEQFKSSKSPKKEWEIVAYAGDIGSGSRIYELCDDGEYRWKADLNKIPRSAKKLVDLGCIIHSVRRLSDGEVFTKNEVAETPKDGQHHIGGFEIVGNDIVANFSTGKLLLKHLQKLPQPILTTVDGVEIRENEECWIVDKYYKLLPEPEKINEFKRNYYSNCFIFSTREAAEEYILNNRPLLSLNDVKEAMQGNWMDAQIVEKLTALVKQKLNQ